MFFIQSVDMYIICLPIKFTRLFPTVCCLRNKILACTVTLAPLYTKRYSFYTTGLVLFDIQTCDFHKSRQCNEGFCK